jgi:hypothetical protein
MISERLTILLNKKIDGCLSDTESAEVETALATDPEAQRVHRELVALAERLGRLEAVEPPPELRSSVMAAVARKQQQPSRIAGLWMRIVSLGHLTGRLRYGVTFAAGLAVGALVFAISGMNSGTGHDISPREVLGTIAGIESEGTITPRWDMDFRQDDITGSVALMQIAPRVAAVRVSIDAQEAVTLELDYDHRALQFRGIHYRDDTAGRLESSGRGLRVIHNGYNEYTLVFAVLATAPFTADFRILRDSVLFRDRLSFQPLE